MIHDVQQQQAAELPCHLLQLLSVCHELETRLAQQSGISVGELRCLRLFFFDRQYAVKEMTKRSGLSSSRLSRVLDRLEKNGMIIRNIDSKDHRSFLVTLTAKGTELVEELRRTINELRESVQEEISAESMEIPIRFLQEMLNSFARKLGTLQRPEVHFDSNLVEQGPGDGSPRPQIPRPR